ncbi:hypothetical protein BO78DRAFT_422219 [Aspergillus sclerotiicarbonarius CBS 121057]|uniref:Uncharacterized protein n=1 Tax=Aspergillus sclerotiicarbonarius (strain CBS 121057 / IBT 28362) TaxID=1448318 RepID=A0A319DYC2_ASPSB|nr:hypothetical protein BO78DRAFT_422219 [Aspergillus sclerotiicarbonarius CBS 121057]
MNLLSTIIASALAFTVSVHATDCTAGLNYCGEVLLDVGNPMMFAQIEAKYPDAYELDIVSPTMYLWHCNADGSVTMLEKCIWDCVNAGAGNTDYCK